MNNNTDTPDFKGEQPSWVQLNKMKCLTSPDICLTSFLGYFPKRCSGKVLLCPVNSTGSISTTHKSDNEKFYLEINSTHFDALLWDSEKSLRNIFPCLDQKGQRNLSPAVTLVNLLNSACLWHSISCSMIWPRQIISFEEFYFSVYYCYI